MQEGHRQLFLASWWVADGVGETSETTSLALQSSGNLPGDIPSSIRGESHEENE